MTLHTALMIAAIIILIVNIILTIIEAYHYYHSSFSQHSPSINPKSRPARERKLSAGDDTVMIDGMRYNVRWILRNGKRTEGIIYSDTYNILGRVMQKEDFIYEDTDSIKVVK